MYYKLQSLLTSAFRIIYQVLTQQASLEKSNKINFVLCLKSTSCRTNKTEGNPLTTFRSDLQYWILSECDQ